MPRFFIDSENINGSKAVVTGSDAVHIGRSLRMRLGDGLTLCCNGLEYDCLIETISDTQVVCTVLKSGQGENEPDIRLTLYQACPKSDKLEYIIQKATELGVTEICPVLTSRCVSRPDEKSFRKKLDRYNRIALEAAKQCGRSVIPTVSGILTLEDCVKRLSNEDVGLICYEKGGRNLREIFTPDKEIHSVGLFIGSEGGFSPEEAELCTASGIIPIGLGKRILRCETASVAAVSIIMNLTGNM